MPETYPLKAPASFAGTYCTVKVCKNYARFTAEPWNSDTRPVPSCGHHLSVIIKGLHATEGKPVVVKEVPGNWGTEQIVIDHRIVKLAAADRKPE